MERTNEATIVINAIHYAFNVSYEDWENELAFIIDHPSVHQSYAEEKFDAMRRDFGRFFCELDTQSQNRFMERAMARYANRNRS